MKKEETLIQTENVRVRIIELQPAEATPFHYHTEITDNMFGVSGEIVLRLKNPDEEVILIPGGRCKVNAGRIHQVANKLDSSSSAYLLIQGVGHYDFIESK